MKKLLVLVTLVLFVGLCGCKQGTRQKAKDTLNSAKKELKELRESIEKDLTKKLGLVDKNMKTLEEKVVKAKDKAKKEWKEAIQLMKVERVAMKSKLKELKVASKEKLQKLKAGLKSAFKKLQDKYNKAMGN